MAGLRGNVAWLMAAKQPSKGTPATSAVGTTFKVPFAGGNIAPTRETDRLSETDASRDAGQAYVVTSGVEGEPSFYARDTVVAPFTYWGMGSVATTGTTPNFTHVITPGNTLPYITVWRNISDTLYERFQDCMVGSFSISAEAGGPLTMTTGIQGVTTTRLTADPSTTPAIPVETGAVYSYNEATVTLGGSQTALVRSFELGVENNISRQQTDDVLPYDVYVGTREITLSFDMYFETLAEYNKFYYGGAAGTAISSSIYTTSASFSFDKGTNNSIAFNLPSIAYEEFPVDPDPGGDAIVVSVRASAYRTGSALLTATVKNQIAGGF